MLKNDRHFHSFVLPFSRGLLASLILAIPVFAAEPEKPAKAAASSDAMESCDEYVIKMAKNGDATAKYLMSKRTERLKFCQNKCNKLEHSSQETCVNIEAAATGGLECSGLKERAEKLIDDFDKQCGRLGLGKGCSEQIEGDDSCADAIDAFMESGKKLADCKRLADDKSCSFANSPTPKKEEKKEDSTDSKIKKLVNGEKGGINISLTNGEKDKEKTPAEQLSEIDQKTNDRLQALDKEEAAAKRNARASDLKVDQNYVNNRDEQRKAILAVARAKDRHFENCQNYAQGKLNALDAEVNKQDAIIKEAKRRKIFRVNSTQLAGFKRRRLQIINNLRDQSYHKNFHECIEGIVALGKESSNQILATEREKAAIDARFTDQSFVLEKERNNAFIELNEELTRIATARQNTISVAAQSKQAIMQAEEKKQQEEQRKKMEELMKQIAEMATPDDQKTCNPDFLKEVKEKYTDLKSGNSSYQRARRACEGLIKNKCSDVGDVGCQQVGIELGAKKASSSTSTASGKASARSSKTSGSGIRNSRSTRSGNGGRNQTQPAEAQPSGQAEDAREHENSTGAFGK